MGVLEQGVKIEAKLLVERWLRAGPGPQTPGCEIWPCPQELGFSNSAQSRDRAGAGLEFRRSAEWPCWVGHPSGPALLLHRHTTLM